jgi:hypothetical protein
MAPPSADHERPGYNVCSFVDDFVESGVGKVPRVATELSWRDRAGTVRARMGLWRNDYLIAPGLYCTGKPTDDSPVLVTANYKLSFDSLRHELSRTDAWLLVLDTRGINVWCASAHKTFGTDELLRMIKRVGLEQVVNHRRLIVPQLGAIGVDGRQVAKSSGFEVVWGPLRAADIPAFLANSCEAGPAMRSLTFTLAERLVLSPVELTLVAKPSLIILAVLLIISGIGPGIFSPGLAWVRWQLVALPFLAGLLSGAVMVPVLLPWLPFRAFYLKGIIVGLPAAWLGVANFGAASDLEVGAQVLVCLVISSYAAMNFTGATPYASPSGVEKEMRLAIPLQVLMTVIALSLWVAAPFLEVGG